MIDYINYNFDLYPLDIDDLNGKYRFIVNNEKYYFIEYDRDIKELNDIYKLNKEMINNGSLVHEIIINKYNKILSDYNGKAYILLRTYVNDDKKIDISDIISMLNEGEIIYKNNSLDRTNWINLWESKVDYIEYQMVHVLKKYPLVNSIIDYYIGLSENAISYLNEISSKLNGKLSLGVCHKRITNEYTLFDLYNPLNLIIDFKIRDIAEYLKSSIIDNLDVYSIYDSILNKYRFDKLNLSLLVARLLYPSYFFDMLEDIFMDKVNERMLNKLIKKSSKIEEFINNVILESNLQSINWLKSK